jgi:hypothetical protein
MILSAVILVVFAAYLVFLTYAERQAEAHHAALRATAPDRYLEETRQALGYDHFLQEFRELKGYDAWHETVPSFLLGRWALFDEAKRVSDLYFPASCLDAVAIEDGRIKLLGENAASHAAEYRLDGNTVTARLADGRELPIRLVAYGVRLHHIELTPPGYEKAVYGYLCK